MANNVEESLSDASSQKSVTDWLMHVISGNLPGDTEVPDLREQDARPDAALPTMNGAHRLADELTSHNGTKAANGTAPNGVASNGVVPNGVIAHGSVPNGVVSNGSVSNGVVANGSVPNGLVSNGLVPNGVLREEKVSEFTADDLCGPPAFGPVTVKEEIKAEDLCWVPGPQQSETSNWMANTAVAADVAQVEPAQSELSNRMVNAAIAAEAAHVETAQDNVIAMPDVERDSSPVHRAEETVEDWEPRKYVISTADILRERAPALVPQSSSGMAAAGMAGFETRPEVMVGSSAHALAPSEVPTAAEPEREVVLADILRDPSAEYPVVAAEPQVIAPVEAVAPMPVVEPQVFAPVEAVAPIPVVEPQVFGAVEAAAPMPVVESQVGAPVEAIAPMPVVEPQVFAAVEAAAPIPVVEPQVIAPVEAVGSMPVVESQVVAHVEPVAPAASVVETTPVEMAASPVPEARAVVIPMEARVEQASAAPQVQSAVAEAIPVAEPMRVVAAESATPTVVGHPVGEIVGSEAKKEPATPSEAKTNVVSMGGEQGANRPRAKRIPRAKRDQVVTIADICRDWVLEEMLDKAGDTGEVDEEEDLPVQLEDLVEENAAPAESVFAHEGIWGNAGLARPAAAGPSEAAPSEQPEQTPGLVAAERLTEVEGRAGVQSSGVKALLKLGSMLPWLARDFPVVEGANKPQNNALTQEVRDEVAGMRLVQHEIRSTVHDHSLQLKRVEEQLSRVRETLVEEATETADLVDSVKSTNKAVTMFGVGVCVLLLVMLGILVMLVMHAR